MTSVWITRSRPSETVHKTSGWQTIHAPLLTVAPVPTPPDPPRPDDVLIFTSGNAVDYFCAYTPHRHWTVYTVGDATATTARSSGFKKVISAGKDVEALHELVTTTPELRSKRLYYASGQDVSGDLTGQLRGDGFDIVRHVLYETMPITQVPDAIAAALHEEYVLTVFLYSPKGAMALGALDLEFDRLNSISISSNVDSCLDGLGLRSRETAENPTHASMIKQLG